MFKKINLVLDNLNLIFFKAYRLLNLSEEFIKFILNFFYYRLIIITKKTQIGHMCSIEYY